MNQNIENAIDNLNTVAAQEIKNCIQENKGNVKLEALSELFEGGNLALKAITLGIALYRRSRGNFNDRAGLHLEFEFDEFKHIIKVEKMGDIE